jgi:hypothetical protein
LLEFIPLMEERWLSRTEAGKYLTNMEPVAYGFGTVDMVIH